MYLTILDLILILGLFLFIAVGFALGFIQAVGALMGALLGGWLAAKYYLPFATWLQPFLFGHDAWANVIAFILIFVLINRAIGLIFWVIGKVFHLISIIPFTKTANRILGALLGLLEGTVVLGLTLYFVVRLPFSTWFESVMQASQVAAWLIKMASFLAPFVPIIIDQAKNLL